MYHNFFIHSAADGHLGCFHVLAIVNTAAVNTGVHVRFSIMVFSGYMPSSGIAGSHESFTPSLLGNLHSVLYNSCNKYITTDSARGFPFLHILSSIYCLKIFFFFDDGHLDWCEVIPHCSVDLNFFQQQAMLSTFSCVCRSSIWFLWRYVRFSSVQSLSRVQLFATQ